jgi:GTP-binding protein
MERTRNIPTVCIVGRPNVGKSSLFNRLVGERRAVVVEMSGTTRDRVEAMGVLAGVRVKYVDTGGYLTDDPDELSGEVREQIFGALREASLLIMVTDSMAGLNPADQAMTEILRKYDKDVVLVANKTDNDRLEHDAMEFYRLGLGKPEPVSCLHGRGIRSLKKRIRKELDLRGGESAPVERPLRIAVVGRPNVGKSSFVNRLLDVNRVIVSDIPGTTRDSVDTAFSYEGRDYELIDTAGIRHRRKVTDPVDSYSMIRSRESIARADVVMLLLDASEGIRRDDMLIIDHIEDKGKPCLLVVNKWDLAGEAEEDVSAQEYEKHLYYASSRLVKMPVCFVSSLTGENITKTLSMAEVLEINSAMDISTPFLNRIFDNSDPSLVPIPKKSKRPNFLYIVQSSAKPVEFKYFVNDPGLVLPAHLSYIENQLRENLPLKGIPVRVHIVSARKSKRRTRGKSGRRS